MPGNFTENSHPSIKPITILLVEDNLSDALLIKHELESQRLTNQVLHFLEGFQALDYIFRTGEYAGQDVAKPGLILLDLKMPRMSGIEVLRRVKTEPTTRNIPVVILTGSRNERDLTATYLYGANSYVEKPLDFERFTKVVREIGLYWSLYNEVP